MAASKAPGLLLAPSAGHAKELGVGGKARHRHLTGQIGLDSFATLDRIESGLLRTEMNSIVYFH